MMKFIRQTITCTVLRRRLLLAAALCAYPIFNIQAQIKIGGNVYGGGNQGDVSGNTSVTLCAGDLNKVYGGARMANVGGGAFVHVDGEHASSYMIVNYVFGGNDVSGTVGTIEGACIVPSELTEDVANSIDNTWNSFVRISTKTNAQGQATADNQKIFIGQLFGGGNGDYTYSETPNAQNLYVVSDGVNELGTSTRQFNRPTLRKSYLEILGGSIAYVFGGGNKATVTHEAVICVDNPSEVVTSITDADDNELVTETRLHTDMGLNAVTVHANSSSFQIGYCFGGNNKAAMAIQPSWYLNSGKIRNLYSGGNEGDMTSPVGLLLEIQANSEIVVDNVYGGCRKADVRPKDASGNDITNPNNIQLENYFFPAGLPARVLVRGGDINNVYGGNDISGDIWGGTAVGVYTSIRGDVYGGGNGSYAYTDNADLKDDLTWRDFFYDVNEILGKPEGSSFTGLESAQALSVFRPNAEQVSVRLHSPDANHKTIIGGAVYVGGNSATLRNDRTGDEASGELKIGSYVVADEVFLANNGVNMIDAADDGLLNRYAGSVEIGGVSHDFSQMDLTDKATFAKYMDGCAMSIHPRVVFDNVENGDPDTYSEYTTAFGSLYCGGNVGSMTWSGTTTLNVNHKVIIYDKVVGGCKNANVAQTQYNAEYLGGIIGSEIEQAEHGKENPDGSIKDCMILNLTGIRMQPKRWIDVSHKELGVEWNTYDLVSGSNVNVMPNSTGTSTADDINRRLRGGNIYGGCYESGHVNGNVVINLTDNIIEKDVVFDIVEKSGSSLYGNHSYNITQRNSGVILDEQGMDPLGLALNVFGGGYGKDTEVWGSTTVNLTAGYTFQIFGGGERGGIGKHNPNSAGKYIFDEPYVYPYDARYSTHVNMHGRTGGTETNNVAETEFIYGGSFMAPIAGNTIVHLGNGRIFNSFAGSCNADVMGHTETYIGLGVNASKVEEPGFPYVRDHVYGGNDLGGRILGEKNSTSRADCDFSSRVRSDILSSVYNSASTTTASAYVEYQQGHVLSIFGGAYGDYDYTNGEYSEYFNADGSNKPGFTKPRLGNAFINFKPVSTSNSLNGVEQLYGAGQGRSGVLDRDVMQERSYILVDIPQNITTFQDMAVFGAGSYSGLGMEADSATVAANPDMASAVIDLFRGQLTNVYGASYKEGVTRRTVVNVPSVSTVKLTNIFGGAYGINNTVACDAYESNVNFNTGNTAIVYGGIYGGNNAYRRTIYSKVNISAPVYSNDSRTYQGYVYGAGLGKDTWSHYTDVNIYDGGVAYKVYGGGNDGQVLNTKSLAKKAELEPGIDLEIDDYNRNRSTKNYNYVGLDHALVVPSALDGTRHNTNVRLHQGAEITGYAYGAGRGGNSVVSGTTNGEVLGGTVDRDFYAGGEGGAVRDLYSLRTFTATTNLYVESGSVRNCYGGGYLGDVGYIAYLNGSSNMDDDVLGESYVVVGKKDGTGFYDGIPAVTRNAYAGGEGGSVYGSAHLTVNNGYVGYRYNSSGSDDASTTGFNERYEPELVDGSQSIENAGNCFGGGYILNSYVDDSYVTLYNGNVRGSLYGGGELGPIGRGQNSDQYGPSGVPLSYPIIHKGGSTTVTMYGGHVMRDVFGGGRGEDSWGGDGTMFMSDAQKALSDFNAKGFVYGTTRVNVHGGEVGTPEGVANGYGNVFGGGDIGFVYSSTGTKVGTDPNTLATSGAHAGLPVDGGGYYYLNGDPDQGMTLDCSVDISPSCFVTSPSGITIDGRTFAAGEYVPVEYLNKLKNKDADASQWAKLDLEGIIVRNAVFAGGNVSAGSDKIFVNSKTVFGNVVAALRDVYHRDLITIGTEHTGGLYGDGNLTFVDGYRELNISNYGTDFYGLEDKITIEQYHQKSDRERAYFKLEYECVHDVIINGVSYSANSTIDEETYNTFPDEYKNESYWTLAGFCSIYAGRLINTIQRADMVGVFGSRMVLQGATDRVPEKADYTQYTINRVGELSLNRTTSEAGDTAEKDRIHGNYFGIYNVVNYLGALTSDVKFTDVRTTDVKSGSGNEADETTSYYDWKYQKNNKSNRNNATSLNKLSLASGVYLEIIREESEKAGETIWGDITGVVELDLIDVMTGLGGGYVYARNEHGIPTHHDDWHKVILSPYNATAYTYKKYTYTQDDASKLVIETSGNFVHNTKQIVDDCFPVSNRYLGADAMKAHYWYIKGSVYVYDQYISAYTGSATAYSQSVSIPLTITIASHGELALREVKPSLYAYYDKDMNPLGRSGSDATYEANGITYSMNDPITWWEWSQLKAEEQTHFVNETYTTVMECEHEGVTYPKGYTILPSEYNTMKSSISTVYCPERESDEEFTYVFRPTNNVGHDTGYLLTFDIDNPLDWDKWYTKNNDLSQASRIPTETYKDPSTTTGDYTVGPTYHLNASSPAVYGQRYYNVGDIIPNPVKDTYDAITPSYLPSGQAVFEEAYVVTSELTITDNNGAEHHLYPGVPIVESGYPAANWSAITGKVAKANVVTSTLQLSEQEFIYAGDLLTNAQMTDISTQYPDITSEVLEGYVAKAYYCSQEGNYGGQLFEPGRPYRAIDAWCSLSEEDRTHFTFTYDALDLLIDPEYRGGYGDKPLYDGVGTSDANVTPNNPLIYTKRTPVDYTARYDGSTTLTYTDEKDQPVSYAPGTELTREQYEDIPNERYHYASFSVPRPGTYYVVRDVFMRGDMPYLPGESMDETEYQSLNANQKLHVDVLTFTDADVPSTLDANNNPVYTAQTYYYCRSSYTVGEDGEGVSVTNVFSGATYNNNQTVPLGTVISQSNYTSLKNLTISEDKQLFTIFASIPNETTTLYVSRESDIFDLSKKKVITVVYQYDYEESDESGMHITPVSERHVVNIHLEFKSGVPQIGQLSTPPTILPGTTVGLKVPTVTPGAYEILSSGWELFENGQDAANHKNGQPYVNNNTPMYWYQDGYYVAYYAKTYLGKTYSNEVPFSVANYHDIDDVVADKANHYFIDHKDVKRDPKIYINDYSSANQNGLDLFKQLFDLSLLDETSPGVTDGVVTSGEFEGHSLLNNRVSGGENLEFFLRTNIDHSSATWTPIGTSTCFAGTLHGDGNTISGLDHSLFDKLCGQVYNLGVTGSFTQAGIVNSGDGYVENCWIMSSAANVDDVHAVFGNPTRGSGQQVVNCYYPDTNNYNEAASARGNARKMSLKSFYNGEVTYDLNGFYLNKRYFDQTQSTGKSYGFYRVGADGTLSAPEFAYYPADYAYYPLEAYSQQYGYVENRYADGDFIYAGGSVPESANERLNETVMGSHYYPIWPDDYIFFGQKLNYGHISGRTHQDTPSRINKSGNRLTAVSADINRVFRAPAYFRSGNMGVAHYNPYAIFAQKSKDGLHEAYPGMTAIDFTGANGDVSGGYKSQWQGGHFFPPLLDHDGLEALRNVDLTRNWLVYTPAATSNDQDANSRTNEVVTTYLHDVAYSEDDAQYRTVANRDETTIYGHAVVQQSGGSFSATTDHLLVDKQDFNAPISYTFASGKRMYYQRIPDNYVDMNTGWESVSLPFKAELVTTQDKGELTHFYGDSRRGHEYWLREYRDISGVTDDKATAIFTYPAAMSGNDKEYTSTFLWDYYYSANQYNDAHNDDYQESDMGGDYYKTTHTYASYPLLQAATPYIIGFPGARYYEFDLSGSFEAQHTAEPVPGKLDVQTITFASDPGITIAVSDTELNAGKVEYNGYTFWPNYLEGVAPTGGFVMADDGGSYVLTTDTQTDDEKKVLPFRTYFTLPTSPGFERARQIIFSNENSSLYTDEEDNIGENGAPGRLIIRAKRGRIIVSSTLSMDTSVRIVSAAGHQIDTYQIEPGETVETTINVPGVYIVNHKKIVVK